MDAIEYWQTVGQQEEWEAAEAMRWYEELAARMNSQEYQTQGINHGIRESSEEKGKAPFGADRPVGLW
jgi:hypothetical protein